MSAFGPFPPHAAGQQFIDWLISPQGQKVISDYKINGQLLFFPNANDPNA
jgi:tungstate transport system substrate-binding protein